MRGSRGDGGHAREINVQGEGGPSSGPLRTAECLQPRVQEINLQC